MRQRLSRVALDTLSAVAEMGVSTKSRELTAKLGLPVRTIFWRLARLEELGMLRVVGSEWTGRRPATTWALTAKGKRALARRQALMRVLPLPTMKSGDAGQGRKGKDHGTGPSAAHRRVRKTRSGLRRAWLDDEGVDVDQGTESRVRRSGAA